MQQMGDCAFCPDLLFVPPFEGLTKKEEKGLKEYPKQGAIHLSVTHFHLATYLLPFSPRLTNTMPNTSFNY